MGESLKIIAELDIGYFSCETPIHNIFSLSTLQLDDSYLQLEVANDLLNDNLMISRKIFLFSTSIR